MAISDGVRQLSGTTACVVQLRCASLPSVLGLIADHYWFVVLEETTGARHRWEVWQRRNAGGTSIGHVHCDLKDPDAGVGGGAARIEREWRGQDARRLRDVLTRAREYPHCHRYRYWPGPNSNTFAAWVLGAAGIEYRLGRRAIGWRYLRK